MSNRKRQSCMKLCCRCGACRCWMPAVPWPLGTFPLKKEQRNAGNKFFHKGMDFFTTCFLSERKQWYPGDESPPVPFLPQNKPQPLTVQWKTIVLIRSHARHLELSKRHFLAHFHLQTAQNGTVEKCGTPAPILKSNNWFTITLHVRHCKPVFNIFFWNNVKYYWHSSWSVIV